VCRVAGKVGQVSFQWKRDSKQPVAWRAGMRVCWRDLRTRCPASRAIADFMLGVEKRKVKQVDGPIIKLTREKNGAVDF